MKSKIKKISAIFCAVFLFAFSIFLIPKKIAKADNELTPSGTVYTSNTYFCSLRAFYGSGFTNPNQPQYSILTNSFITAIWFTLVEDSTTLTLTIYYLDYSIPTNTQHVNQSGATNSVFGGVQNVTQQVYATLTFQKSRPAPYITTAGSFQVPTTVLAPTNDTAYMFPCVYSSSDFEMINSGLGVYDLIGATVSQYYIHLQNTTLDNLYFLMNYSFVPTDFTTMSDYEGQSCTVNFHSFDNFAYTIQSEYIAFTLPFLTFTIPAVIPQEEIYTLSFGGGITPESDNEYYQLGYNNGYSNAQNSLQVTYENRINQAYARGYDDGQTAGTDFYQYFLAIAEVPFRLVYSFLNFNILGINVANFVTAVLTGLLVIGVIRLFV